MAKRPNKMGRIEGEPKVSKFKRVPWANIGVIVLGVALISTGALGVLRYQKFIADTKAQGVSEFKELHCDSFTDKKKNVEWLECDV